MVCGPGYLVQVLHDLFLLNDPIYYYYLDKCVLDAGECGPRLVDLFNGYLYPLWLLTGDIRHVMDVVRVFLRNYYGLKKTVWW